MGQPLVWPTVEPYQGVPLGCFIWSPCAVRVEYTWTSCFGNPISCESEEASLGR